MSYYTGCDAHSRTCSFQLMDSDGSLGISKRVSTDKLNINRFFEFLDEPTIMVLEAGRNWWWLYQYFNSHPKVKEVHIVDPRRARKLSSELSVQSGYGRASNDRIDSEMLAELARKELAPKIHPPTPRQLEQRTINRHRLSLVWDRTAYKNFIHSKAAFHGFSVVIDDLMIDPDSILKLEKSVPVYVVLIIKQCLDQIRTLDKSIADCDRRLDKLLPSNHPNIQLLSSHPGIGLVIARIIITEIFDIKYFKDHWKYLISYSGLAPFEQDSDGTRKGKIKLNRQCNYYLKYAFIEAAHSARNHPKYKRKYELDVKKQGKIIAKLNLARRVVKAVYWMLTRQEPFRYQ